MVLGSLGGLFVDMFCCVRRWIRGEKGEDVFCTFWLWPAVFDDFCNQARELLCGVCQGTISPKSLSL